LGERRLRDTVAEPHEPFRPAAEYTQIEPGGQAVDDGDADPVQPARDFVRILIEFSAGMEVGHDDLGSGNALLVVDADGDAAAVVRDGNGAIGVQGNGDRVAVAGERLVDRIV